ncbi:ABC transporter permease [Haloechinothrix halophila]|uniref:ABC transporter permease n=1 Tax=Haloechinothrix halophila TaxID=1069073 RepID=UPI0004085774|nr:ABC transporter permease [Haloechinothrix halophila]
MTSAAAVRLVAQRELALRLRTKWFLIGTLVIIAVMAGYVLLQMSVFGGEDRSKIGFAGQATGLSERVAAAASELEIDVETTTVVDLTAARADLSDGSLDAVVSGTPAELRVLVAEELNPRLRAVLTGLSQQEVLTAKLAQAGVPNPARVMAEANATRVEVTAIEPSGAEDEQRLAIGAIMVFLLFMSINAYGTLVAQGVVEEKASRVVEILLATIRPWQLLLGKIIGIGLVGLIQLVAIAGAGIALALAADVLTLSGVAVGTLVWGVIWYLLGFFLYAALFAGAGALVSRQEDAQSVLTPVTMVLVVGFLAGFNVMIADPDGTAARVLSLIPLMSPVLMPGRIAAGDVAVWESALAIGLTLAAITLVTYIGGRIYQNAVLHTGSRMKLTAALRG